jgi:hypothetical protein
VDPWDGLARDKHGQWDEALFSSGHEDRAEPESKPRGPGRQPGSARPPAAEPKLTGTVYRDWLRAAAQGRVPVTEAPTENSESLLTFTEPNFRFSVAAVEDDSLVLRVQLSLESVAGRPGADEESPYAFYAHSAPCDISWGTARTPRTAVGLRRGRSTQCERPRGAQAR